MNYPVWTNDGKEPRPEARIFYIISRNGFFLRKQNLFWDVTVPVESIPEEIDPRHPFSADLQHTPPSCKLFLPPLPTEIFLQILEPFAYVWQTMQAEAMVLLWIHAENKTYRVNIPPQSVSAGGVQYQVPDRAPGELLIGTFHSHCIGPAYHSGVDTCDERSMDGIHGTIGRIGARSFTVSLQTVVNGFRFLLNPFDMLQGICEVERENHWGENETIYNLASRELILPENYIPPEEGRNITRIFPRRYFGIEFPDRKEGQR